MLILTSLFEIFTLPCMFHNPVRPKLPLDDPNWPITESLYEIKTNSQFIVGFEVFLIVVLVEWLNRIFSYSLKLCDQISIFDFHFYGNLLKVFGNFLWWTSKYMSLYIFCKYESKSDYIWSVNQRPPYGLLKVWHFYPENNQKKIYGTHWYLSLVKSSRSWLPLIFPFGP